MSKTACKYHPLVPARWHCSHCNIDLCSGCVKREMRMEEVCLCPACGNEAAALAMSNVITPFWQRLGRFFAYPLGLHPLVYMAVLALLPLLADDGGLLQALARLATLLVFLRYGYAALDETAHGHLEPPRVSFSMVNEGLELPVKQFFVLVVLFGAAGVAAAFGEVLGVLAYLLVLVVLPASVMALAVEKRFAAAVNPAGLLVMAARIGWPYLLLCGFLLLLSGAEAAADSLLGGGEPGAIQVYVMAFTSMYFSLVMFAMMGYVIYQYHEVLGYEVEVDFDETAEAARAPRAPADPFGGQVRVLIHEGRIDDALATLGERVREPGAELALHEQYHKLLALAGRNGELTGHGRGLITRLLAQGRAQQALQVYEDCRKADPAFAPEDPAQVLPLASLANDQNRAQLALAIMNGFGKRHRGHGDIPAVYLLAARVLAERQRNDAAARRILEDLRAAYPDHPLRPQVDQYLTLMDRLAASAGPAAPAP